MEAWKTATRVKRAASLRLFSSWFSTTGRPATDVFAERTVFDHMQYLNEERVGATRGIALTQAINFAGGMHFNLRSGDAHGCMFSRMSRAPGFPSRFPPRSATHPMTNGISPPPRLPISPREVFPQEWL